MQINYSHLFRAQILPCWSGDQWANQWPFHLPVSHKGKISSYIRRTLLTSYDKLKVPQWMPREKFDWTSSCISTASWGSTCWNCISPLLRKQKSNFILSISITEQNLVNRIVQNKHFNIVNQVLSVVKYWFKYLTKSLQKGFPWSDIRKCELVYFLCPSGVSDLTQIIWHKLHCRGVWHLKQCAAVRVGFAFLIKK